MWQRPKILNVLSFSVNLEETRTGCQQSHENILTSGMDDSVCKHCHLCLGKTPSFMLTGELLESKYLWGNLCNRGGIIVLRGIQTSDLRVSVYLNLTQALSHSATMTGFIYLMFERGRIKYHDNVYFWLNILTSFFLIIFSFQILWVD